MATTRNTEEVEIVYAPSATGITRTTPILEKLRNLDKTQTILLALVVGIAIGLIVGWVIWPVEWTNAGFSQLAPERQAQVIRLTSWVYAFSQNDEVVRTTLNFKSAGVTGCQMVALTGDEGDRARIQATLSVAGIACEVYP